VVVFHFFLINTTWSQCTIEASPDTTICAGTQAHLNVSGQLMFSYNWSPVNGLNASFIPNPYAHPSVTTTYHVTVTTLIDSNLIVNGDFELGNTAFSSNYTYNPTSVWNEATYAVTTNPQIVHPNFAACSDHTSGSGNMMVVNGAGTANITFWCQSVAVQPNTDYAFSTWLTTVVTSSPGIMQFSINNIQLGTPFTAPSTNCTWQQFYVIWNSGSATTANICIVNQNTATSGNDFAIDDISFKPFCVATDSVTVSIKQVPAFAGNDTAVCKGDPALLSASGGASYHWDSGHNTKNVTIFPATDTIYYVTVTDSQGCKGEDSVRVSLMPLPVVSAGDDQYICPKDTATLTGSGGIGYLWSNGQQNQTIRVVPPLSSIYQLTVTDTNGCKNRDSLIVFVRPAPEVVTNADTGVCPGLPANLMAAGALNYIWAPATGLSAASGAAVTATPEETTIYYVTGTDTYGCKDSAAVKVEILECGLTIPNVFTPNADGKNDLFFIDYKGIRKYDLRIYNRWGRVVFESTRKDHFWDGRIDGTPAASGTYFYILLLDKTKYSGSITLMY
jgi:gliding motility-associated-like protein